MARVLISAAHTMENPGEIYQDLREADLTRNILKKAIPYLEQHQLEFQAVPLDLPLLQRIEWINNTGYTEEAGDIFVEIHINDGGKRGVEGWYKGAQDPENQSQKLCEAIVGGICKYTKYEVQGAKSEYEHELQSLLILNQTNPIGTAVECLYIDNPEDIVILKDEAKLDELAKAIADAINDYVTGKPATLPAATVQPTTVDQVTDTTSIPAQAQSSTITSPLPSSDPISGSNTTATPVTPTSPIVPASTPISAPAPIPVITPPPVPTITPPPTPSFPPPSPFGGSGFGGFGGNKPFGAPSAPPSGGSKPLVMDREERKKMINDTYKKILGKEPNQSDLNYYLNLGTNEDELVKKLLESPEHEKMVKDAEEAAKLRTDFQKIESELTQAKAGNSDLKKMFETTQELLKHKNNYIAELQNKLTASNIVPPGQHIHSVNNAPQHLLQKPPKAKKKKGFINTMMRAIGI